MGRPPKPAALSLIDGNPGKRPLKEEPPVEMGAPDCPEHLEGEAVLEWNRVSAELEAAGLLAKVDRAALAAYCQCWSRWIDAEAKIKEFGLVIKAPSGYAVQSPYLSIANRALDQMRSFLSEFGMTPVSRARVAKPTTAKPKKNPFQALAG